MSGVGKILYFEGVGSDCQLDVEGAIHRMRIRTVFHGNNGNPVFLEISAGWRVKGKDEKRFFYEKEPYASITAREERRTVKPLDGHDTVMLESVPITTGGDVEQIDGVWQQTYRYRYTKADILAYLRTIGYAFDGLQVLPDLSGYAAIKSDYDACTEIPYNYGDEFEPDWDLIAKRENIEATQYERDIKDGIKSPYFSLWVDPHDPHVLHYKNFRRKPQVEKIIRI